MQDVELLKGVGRSRARLSLQPEAHLLGQLRDVRRQRGGSPLCLVVQQHEPNLHKPRRCRGGGGKGGRMHVDGWLKGGGQGGRSVGCACDPVSPRTPRLLVALTHRNARPLLPACLPPIRSAFTCVPVLRGHGRGEGAPLARAERDGRLRAGVVGCGTGWVAAQPWCACNLLLGSQGRGAGGRGWRPVRESQRGVEVVHAHGAPTTCHGDDLPAPSSYPSPQLPSDGSREPVPPSFYLSRHGHQRVALLTSGCCHQAPQPAESRRYHRRHRDAGLL